MISEIIGVYFDGAKVGALAKFDGDRYATFEYTEEWIDDGFSISPIHLPLRPGTFTFPGLPEETFKGLPGVFADSLPDDFGNALIDQWLARNGKSKRDFGALDRLLYIGMRGMGALEYQPATEMSVRTSQSLDVEKLVRLSQDVLNDRSNVGVITEEDDAIFQLFQIGTSAGGARAKAVIAMNEDRSQILSGQVPAPEGFEHYLIKFDGIDTSNKEQQSFGDPKGYGAMEYAYYRMATDCGVHMSHCELLREGGRSHFVTQRFDRQNNLKFHTLTLCGMDHADFQNVGFYSYEQLLAVARELDLPYEDQLQIYKRMIFNVIARNQDDHTKNVAFYVDIENIWRLAPAYDIAFSYKPGSPWVSEHAMSINGKRDDFTKADLLKVSDQITGLNRSKAQEIINNTKDVVSNWPTYAKDSGVFDSLTSHINNHLRLGTE